ncbi:hypothetical protein KP509_05G053400 [Ceratopteris richardii]|nr:hypothetical protein KP509_05G053400 [Ceratopteris richardii]KAH7437037.1 hypothetical protein KP509_05G053400 [Ceratopteris richardii]
MPHWMCSNQGLDLKLGANPRNEFIPSMAISSQAVQQNSMGSLGTSSLPSLGIDSKQQDESSIDISLRVNTHQNQLHSRSPISGDLKSLSIVGVEEKEIAKEDLGAFLLRKEQGQVGECISASPSMLHAQQSGKSSDKKLHVSSWLSKFPFQIDPEGEFSQSMDQEAMGYGKSLELHKESIITKNSLSQLVSSKNNLDHHINQLLQQSSSEIGASKSVTVEKTNQSFVSSSKWTSLETLPGLRKPSSKHGWNAAVLQSSKVSQFLPDFYTQRKTTSSNIHLLNKNEETPEIMCKELFPQKAGSITSSSIEVADRNRNFVGHRDMIKQESFPGKEAQRWPTHCSPSEMIRLNVKVDTSSEFFGASCSNSASKETEMKSLRTGFCENNLTNTNNQVTRQLSSVDLDVSKCCIPKEVGKKMPLSEGNQDVFSGGSTLGQSKRIKSRAMLPFQHRFDQLQEFLRKCDGSEKEYIQRAFLILSANAKSDHISELQSRASRLDFEEGMAMKKAKLLNMVEDVPVGHFIPHSKMMKTCLVSSRSSTQLKEEV